MHNVSIIKRYHVREIARLTDTVGGTLHKELARLADAGLLLRNNIGITEATQAIYSAQEVLGREINPKVYNKKEWNQMLKNNDAFIKEVPGKPKLFIAGSEYELG